MKKNLYIPIFLFIINLSVAAQQEVKILTPEASELAKYVEIPVGYFGGVPQINIPLYEIVDGDITIPITLSYHAGGFKVNEESSIVGLGWSLNVGGEIILAKRGGGGKGPETVVEDCDDYLPMPTSFENTNPHYHMLEAYSEGRYLAENGNHENYFCNMFNGNFEELDGQRDLYIFNFHNYAGKFMFVRKWVNNAVKIVPEVIDRQRINFQKLGLPPNSSNHAYGGKNGLVATTEDGFIYRFEVSDFSRSITKKIYKSGFIEDGGTYPDVVSSYKLTSIWSPFSNRAVTFRYLTPAKRSLHSPTSDYHLKRRKYLNTPDELRDWPDSYEYFSYIESQNRYLEQIVFSDGIVNFHYSDRLDIYNGKKLDSIIVKNNKLEIKKRICFNTLLPHNQNYFTSDSGGGTYPQSNVNKGTLFSEVDTRANKRLKLEDISVGTDLYQFKYNEDIKLPPKTSYAMDYWGFYNGATSNRTLLPNTMDLQYYASYVPQELGDIIGSNRKPDANYMQANILKTIIYPTKGKSSFVYEPHSFKNFGQSYEYKSIQALDNNDFSSGLLPGKVFDIESTQTVTGGFWLQRIMPANSYPALLGQVWVVIQKYNGNSFQNLILYQNGNYIEYSWDLHKEYNTYKATGKLPEGTEISIDGFQFHKDFSITLTPGKYMLFAFYSNDYGFDVKCKAQIWLQYLSGDVTKKELIGGGLRVSEIKDETENGKPIIRKFSYEDGINLSIPKFIREEKVPPASELQFCPGSGMTPKLFSDTYGLSKPDGGKLLGFQKGYDLFSSNVYEFSNSANGSIVGYKKVTVQYSGEENGKSDYFFNISSPSINRIEAPRGIPDVNQIDIGLLTSEKHYKTQSNSFIPIKEIKYNYNTVHDHFVTWNWIAESKPYYVEYPRIGVMETVPSWMITTDDVIHLYPVVFGRKLLDSKIETFLDNSGAGSDTKYLYNQDGHLKSQTLVNNPGKHMVTEYRYPNDYKSNNDPNDLLKLMKNANILKHPIEIVKIFNNRVVSATFNDYKYSDGRFSLLDSYIIDLNEPLSNFNFSNDFAGNKDSHYSLNVSYKYDNKGNITQIIKRNNFPVSFYWGTYTQYPIAKFEGIYYSDIGTTPLLEAKLKEIQKHTKLLADNDKKELNLLNSEIRNIISSNAHVYTYTYDPLVGITSATNPSGITTYYDYDIFGRLKETYIYKDNIVSSGNKQVIESYNYHYQNQ